MTKEALELAKKISISIWKTYDDTYGYASKKIANCEAEGTDDPESMLFFWQQFDVLNQNEFELLLFNEPETPAKKELNDWIKNYQLEVERVMNER